MLIAINYELRSGDWLDNKQLFVECNNIYYGIYRGLESISNYEIAGATLANIMENSKEEFTEYSNAGEFGDLNGVCLYNLEIWVVKPDSSVLIQMGYSVTYDQCGLLLSTKLEPGNIIWNNYIDVRGD